MNHFFYCLIILNSIVKSNPLLFSNFIRSNVNNFSNKEHQYVKALAATKTATTSTDSTATPTATATTPVKDTESVHLQLHKKSAPKNKKGKKTSDPHLDGIKDEKEKNDKFIKLNEYIRANDSTVILASTGSKYELEVFSMHIFGSNYTLMENIQINQVSNNLLVLFCIFCCKKNVSVFFLESFSQVKLLLSKIK